MDLHDASAGPRRSALPGGASANPPSLPLAFPRDLLMCSCGLLVVVVERTWIVAVARVFLSASVSERCRRPRVSLQGMEGTLYATIMSINNFGGIVGSQIGAVITSWLGVTEGHLENFWLLVLPCTPLSPPSAVVRDEGV